MKKRRDPSGLPLELTNEKRGRLPRQLADGTGHNPSPSIVSYEERKPSQGPLTKQGKRERGDRGHIRRDRVRTPEAFKRPSV